MAETIRERCLQALKANIEAMRVDQPVDDPYGITWSVVQRSPFTEAVNKKRYAVAILDGQEAKQTRFPLADCQLDVTVEFRVTRNVGEAETGVLANQALGALQRCISADRRLGGLAIDLKETGNELDIASADDKTVEGVIFLQLQYRHQTDDPRKAVNG